MTCNNVHFLVRFDSTILYLRFVQCESRFNAAIKNGSRIANQAKWLNFSVESCLCEHKLFFIWAYWALMWFFSRVSIRWLYGSVVLPLHKTFSSIDLSYRNVNQIFLRIFLCQISCIAWRSIHKYDKLLKMSDDRGVQTKHGSWTPLLARTHIRSTALSRGTWVSEKPTVFARLIKTVW